jgi:hypothetical protein
MSIFDKLAETDLDNVDTSFPNLAPGTYEFRVESAEKKESDKGGEYLLWACKLVSADALDTKGEALQPGYPLRHMLNLTYTDGIANGRDGKGGKSEEEFEKDTFKDLCKFMDATLGHRKFAGDLEQFVGKTFFAKVKMGKARTNKDTGEVYDPSPQFAAFLPQEGVEGISEED